MEHYTCTSFGASKEYYRGKNHKLAGMGQGNVVFANISRDTSGLNIKTLENEKIEV